MCDRRPALVDQPVTAGGGPQRRAFSLITARRTSGRCPATCSRTRFTSGPRQAPRFTRAAHRRTTVRPGCKLAIRLQRLPLRLSFPDQRVQTRNRRAVWVQRLTSPMVITTRWRRVSVRSDGTTTGTTQGPDRGDRQPGISGDPG